MQNPLKNLWEKTVGGKTEVEQSGSYGAEVSRANKATVIIMCDHSGSMDEKYGADDFSKAEALAFAVNKAIQNILEINVDGEDVQDRFDMAVIGYDEPKFEEYQIGSILPQAIAGQELVTLSELYDNSLNPGEDEEMWIEAYSGGGTPMCAALEFVYKVAEKTCKDKPKSYPPIVLNFSDGEATDGDIAGPAEKLKKLEVDDGNVLLFNCHISSTAGEAILFPDNVEQLPDAHARLIFDNSSYLPASMRTNAEKAGYEGLTENSKGCVFNAQVTDLFKFIDIGTRTGTNLR